MAKIYTKTGDQGETSILGGARLPKSHPRFHAYGTIDELNAQLGLLAVYCEGESRIQSLKPIIFRLQNELFVAGSLLACDDSSMLNHLPPVKPEFIERLEKEIDEWTASLPPLKNFIIPGGALASAQTHVARTVCRRAERWTQEVMGLGGEDFKAINLLILQYLNRLSDHLFTMGRWINQQDEKPDQLWIPS